MTGRTNKQVRRGFVALAAWVFLLAPRGGLAGGAATADPLGADLAGTETIVLMDASADMGAKFALQRHALAAAPAFGGQRLSFAIYGGEACGGFQAVARDKTMAVVLGDVAPAGRRNLVAALESAAAAFPEDAPRKRILAIVGGPNQCLGAPCAFTSKLKTGTPELAVDVIGFGLTDSAARRLDCIAANTGGRFFRADANGLATALTLALSDPTNVLVSLAPPRVAARASAADEAGTSNSGTSNSEIPNSETKVDQIAQGVEEMTGWPLTGPELSFPRGLRLSAELTAGRGLIESGVRFELLRRQRDGVLQLVARTERTATPLFEVPPGPYVARVSIGEVVRDVRVSVPADGVLNRRVDLSAGRIELAAAVLGQPVNSGASFRVESLDAPADAFELSGRGRMLAIFPAGRYRVTARIDGAHAARQVTLPPGALASAVVEVPIGYLRVAPLTGGEGFRVLRRGQEVARGGAGGGLFRLPPGAYRIVGLANETVDLARAVVQEGRLASAKLRTTADDSVIEPIREPDIGPILDAGLRRLVAEQPASKEVLFTR